MKNTSENKKSPLRAPSARVTAALAAAMLAIGVAVGAAIGPAPSPSLANPSLPLLLQTLARGAAARAAQSASAAAQPPAATAEATPRRKRRHHRKKHSSVEEASSAATTTPAAETGSETTTPISTPTKPKSTPKSTPKASALAPVTHVWLIELSGTSFERASAQPAAAPYIDTQAIPAGTLLSGWSALEGGGFANEAALLASGGPQLLDTIVQPPCPEGAAGAACTPETTGAQTAADEFLKATVPTITSSAAFRENGLIVVTFASVANATATGLPAGATTATLTAQPPAGVLLISPFASVGAHSTTAFDPTSPRQSVEKLLRR
ncbi:MAG TPA: hypothetical protein VGX72_14200 [Solirubrobacteraceae bacterium]|jgi:hypothetical protein|nr:hypothetical protein [Solirubrobacteraceae bacterium]